jgi:hypothetical protein
VKENKRRQRGEGGEETRKEETGTRFTKKYLIFKGCDIKFQSWRICPK